MDFLGIISAFFFILFFLISNRSIYEKDKNFWLYAILTSIFAGALFLSVFSILAA